ncbi:efflux RND transporter permease subunit [Sphingobacterium sp. 18053]|uniref:efflux RND transporter permease subunit n=1 Tax=Sphingobacterium sp. 18053 TaxID=2681401 RepID=UPI001357E11C|nr:efflux RND transporter permease subunit [Sphingobacterium sp. 18053]
MIKFLIDRPIAVLVSFTAMLMLGCAAFLKLPVSLLPNVDIPNIVIRVDGPDLSSREVEDQLTQPIRNNLLQLRGLKDVESISSEGVGTIRLKFEHGLDISLAFIEVNEKIDLVMSKFPKEIGRPQVIKSTISDIPVFRLNVYPRSSMSTSTSIADVSSFAREIIRRRIEQIPEVAMVDMTGYIQSQVELIPKKGYLETMDINEEALLTAFRDNTLSLGSILVKDGHYRYYLRFSGQLLTLEALGKIPFNINGRLLTLGEIADINLMSVNSDGFYQSRGQQAVNFAIIKQSSAKMDDLQYRFEELLELMRKDYPDIVFELTQDQTELLKFAVSNLQQDLILGGVLAFSLMLIFIRKLRTAMLIGFTIPLSLIISQLGFYMFGISLNIISLGGLILGLSMIIDNSIVVIDTISDYKKKGCTVGESAVLGTKEIVRPLLTSVLTNCAVFVPLIFMSGLAGSIFFDQAISIVIGVLSSLAVSIFLLPSLYALVHSDKIQKRSFEIKSFVNVTLLYDRILKWCFKWPMLLLFFMFSLVLAGLFAFKSLEKRRLPNLTRNDFEISIDWNEYLEMEEIRDRIIVMSKFISKEAYSFNSWSGPQQYVLPIINNLSYTQNLIYCRINKGYSVDEVQKKILSFMKTTYPSASTRFQPAKNAFDEVFSEDKAPFTIMVSNSLNRKMPEIKDVNAVIRKIRDTLPEVNISEIPLFNKINLRINQNMAIRYGLSNRQISEALERILKNKKISDYQGANSVIPLVLREQQPHSLFNLLNERFIINSSKERIPFSTLVSYNYETSYKYITARNTGEYYPIDITTDNAEKDLDKLEETIAQGKKMGIELGLSGSFFENRILIKEMSMVLLVSILLLYFILAAQFESLLQPLFILLELPIAIFGSFIFLYVGGSSINLMSMIGIVVMSGLIINDSILKVDAINQLRNKGVPLLEAIFEGGHRRIRSIIMISLTSIGALAPTLFMYDLGSELQKPLALALIGGMVVGLFVSLFLVPIVYWFIYKTSKNNA